jgi:hypothetical protein
MAESLCLIDITPENLAGVPCCGIKDPQHEGREVKTGWFRTYYEKGLRAKVLVNEKDVQCGYIEYVPGEYAWRGIEAAGYMVIHCLWTYFKKIQNQGRGAALIQGCVDDARSSAVEGVAVVARKRPWLADSRIFLSSGFRVVDIAPPDYELLALKFDETAPDPSFKGNWEEKVKRYGKGLTIIRSDQCPHTVRFANKIADLARDEYQLDTRITVLETHQDAQNAPTPYTVFAVILDGQLLADHQISKTRFHNILKKKHAQVRTQEQ